MARKRGQSGSVSGLITLDGHHELLAVFHDLPKVMRNRVLHLAIKAGARPIKLIVDTLTPIQAPPFSGQSPKVRLKNLGTKIVRRPRSRKWVGWRIQYPVRAKMNIDAGAKHYYPAALEYGHGNVPPVGMMRSGFARGRKKAEGVMAREVKRLTAIEVAKLAAKKGANKAGAGL